MIAAISLWLSGARQVLLDGLGRTHLSVFDADGEIKASVDVPLPYRALIEYQWDDSCSILKQMSLRIRPQTALCTFKHNRKGSVVR